MMIFQKKTADIPAIAADPAVQAATDRVRELRGRKRGLERRAQAFRDGVPLEWLEQLDALNLERDGTPISWQDERNGTPAYRRERALRSEIQKLTDKITRRAMETGRNRPAARRRAAVAAVDREAQVLLGAAVEELPDPEPSLAELEHDLEVAARAVELAEAELAEARKSAAKALRPRVQKAYRAILQRQIAATVGAGQLSDEAAAFVGAVHAAAGPEASILLSPRTVPYHDLRLSERMSKINVWLDDVEKTHGLKTDEPRARHGLPVER